MKLRLIQFSHKRCFKKKKYIELLLYKDHEVVVFLQLQIKSFYTGFFLSKHKLIKESPITFSLLRID